MTCAGLGEVFDGQVNPSLYLTCVRAVSDLLRLMVERWKEQVLFEQVTPVFLGRKWQLLRRGHHVPPA